MEWKNKVVWITGASSGIGEELVHQLARKNCNLILTSRNEKKLVEVQRVAGLSPKSSMVLPIDLSNYHHIEPEVDKVLDKFGHIDVLINNAGMTQRSFIKDTIIDVDERLMALNYMGPIALTKAVLPHMLARGTGHIVVTSSVAGKLATPLRSTYCASKHALHGFFESLRAEVYKQNIHVTLICPGFIQTNISSNALMGDGSQHRKMDEGQSNGMTVQACVRKNITAIENNKSDVIISGLKEKFALILQKFSPSFFRKMVREMKVT